MKLYCPALHIVGATVNSQEANVQVPPVVLLPTPPATTAPNAKHPLVTLQTLLQFPPPMNHSIACVKFLQPPEVVDP